MRTFDQAGAKAYFIALIVEQAGKSNVPLSEAERYNLAWCETDPSFERKLELDSKFEEETTMEEYEKKVATLIKQAYDAAAASSSEGKQTFRAAYKALSKGDHYLLVMLRAALGMRLQSWWPF